MIEIKIKVFFFKFILNFYEGGKCGECGDSYELVSVSKKHCRCNKSFSLF